MPSLRARWDIAHVNINSVSGNASTGTVSSTEELNVAGTIIRWVEE